MIQSRKELFTVKTSALYCAKKIARFSTERIMSYIETLVETLDTKGNYHV